jgi:hypothetical protein
VYIPCIVPDKSRPDYLVTVDVDPKSNTYSQVNKWFYVQEPSREVSGPILWGVGEQVHKVTRAAPPPITKLIRNQEETVRYILCASGT